MCYDNGLGSGWGTNGECKIQGPVVTWMDLWIAADKLIRDSGDMHHSFIEDFYPHPTKPNTFVVGNGS